MTIRAVWKYPLDLASSQTLALPVGAEIIHVGIDRFNAICMWATVNPKVTNTEHRVFNIVGTGAVELTDAMTHVGSVVQGDFVWHVFETSETGAGERS